MKKLLLLSLLPCCVNAATLLTVTHEFDQQDTTSKITESKGTFNSKEVCIISDTGLVTITKTYKPYNLTSTESFKVKFDKVKLAKDIKEASLAKKGDYKFENFIYDSYVDRNYSTEPYIFRVVYNDFSQIVVVEPVNSPSLPRFVWQTCKFPMSEYQELTIYFDKQ